MYAPSTYVYCLSIRIQCCNVPNEEVILVETHDQICTVGPLTLVCEVFRFSKKLFVARSVRSGRI